MLQKRQKINDDNQICKNDEYESEKVTEGRFNDACSEPPTPEHEYWQTVPQEIL